MRYALLKFWVIVTRKGMWYNHQTIKTEWRMHMNKNAEAFKNYLDEKKIEVFAIEETPDDAQETAVFRSHIIVAGQQLPTIVITDKSIFTLIRVQIAPQVLKDENKAALLDFVNGENLKYKPFKLYFNANGTLLLDFCLINADDELKGDTIYLMFDVIINYLNANYQEIMKSIWA